MIDMIFWMFLTRWNKYGLQLYTRKFYFKYENKEQFKGRLLIVYQGLCHDMSSLGYRFDPILPVCNCPRPFIIWTNYLNQLNSPPRVCMEKNQFVSFTQLGLLCIILNNDSVSIGNIKTSIKSYVPFISTYSIAVGNIGPSVQNDMPWHIHWSCWEDLYVSGQ